MRIIENSYYICAIADKCKIENKLCLHKTPHDPLSFPFPELGKGKDCTNDTGCGLHCLPSKKGVRYNCIKMEKE